MNVGYGPAHQLDKRGSPRWCGNAMQCKCYAVFVGANQSQVFAKISSEDYELQTLCYAMLCSLEPTSFRYSRKIFRGLPSASPMLCFVRWSKPISGIRVRVKFFSAWMHCQVNFPTSIPANVKRKKRLRIHVYDKVTRRNSVNRGSLL